MIYSDMDSLPEFLLLEIFKKLKTYDDLGTVRTVCGHWNNVSNSIILRRRFVLRCETCTLSSKHDFVRMLINSNCKFPNAIFGNVDLRNFNYKSCWVNLGQHLEDLELYADEYSYNVHYKRELTNYNSVLWNNMVYRNMFTNKWLTLLDLSPKLRNLKLAIGRISDVNELQNHLSSFVHCKLTKLQRLKLIVSVGADEMLSFFDQATSTSKLICFELIALHQRCFMEAIEHKIKLNASGIKSLINIVSTHASTLEQLSLKNTDDGVLMYLSKIENLRLSYFSGKFGERANDEFFKSQKYNLREVNIEIYNNRMLYPVCHLVNLHTLTININYLFSLNELNDCEVQLDFLKSLPNLKKFVIAANGLEDNVDEGRLVFTTNEMITHNLEILILDFQNLNYFCLQIDHQILQVIASTFPKLIELKLYNLCDCIALGIDKIFANVKQLKLLVCDCYEYWIGDRIVKTNALANISQLKDLEELHLLNVFNILNDNVLINFLRLDKLKKLSLEGNDFISEAAICKLFDNCPALEHVYLKSFAEMTEKGICYGLQKLANLNVMEIVHVCLWKRRDFKIPSTIYSKFNITTAILSMKGRDSFKYVCTKKY